MHSFEDRIHERPPVSVYGQHCCRLFSSIEIMSGPLHAPQDLAIRSEF